MTTIYETGTSIDEDFCEISGIHLEPEIEIPKKSRRRSAKYLKTMLQIDFVLAAKNFRLKNTVLDQKAKDIIAIRKKYFQNLKKKRLRISPSLRSKDKKTLFWHVHAPFEVLADTAEDLSMRLPTVKNDIVVHVWYEKFLQRLNDWWEKKNPFLVSNSHFSKPESYFADDFDKNRLEEFHGGNDPENLFSRTQRSRLVSYILESTKFGAKDNDIGKDELIDKGVLTAAYPCHDGPLRKSINEPITNTRQKLSSEWASFRKMFKYQPIDGIKDYFGVRIAFYFAWIGFYTTWLVPASLVGVVFFFFGCLSNLWFIPVQEICNAKKPIFMCPLCDKVCSYYFLHNTSCSYSKMTHCFDNDGTPIFAVLISIWSVFYLEYWKRKEWCLSYEWHTMDFNEQEVVRPQYTASAKAFKKNQVTQKLEPVVSRKAKTLKIAGEASVVIFFISLVIAAVIGVVVYRAIIFGVLIASNGSLRNNSKIFVTGTAATINLIVINVLKLIYRKLALIMTEWENPRTRSSYEKSFTLKMFWFQFCNMYASVFYVAFFKNEFFVGYPGNYKRFGSQRSRLEGCSEQGCFLELCVQLLILMGGQQLLGNFIEIFWPYIQKKYNSWRNNIKSSIDVSVWEADYQLPEQEELQLFWEYQEVVLQYGFVTMFVAAFPLAPLIALITNMFEIRIDAINMVKGYRRPVAYCSSGIGVWYDILFTLTTLAVLINGFVLSLTSEFIPRLVYAHRYSEDGTLKGYIDWSLSYFPIADFTEEEKPEVMLPIEFGHHYENVSYCRYPGFHLKEKPYAFSMENWYLMTIRLMFAFLFQWTVSAAGRILAWIIPDRPRTLDLKIKSQEYLAKEALRNYKIRTGKRKPDRENVSDEEEEEIDSEDDSSVDHLSDHREPKSSKDFKINMYRHKKKKKDKTKTSNGNGYTKETTEDEGLNDSSERVDAPEVEYLLTSPAPSQDEEDIEKRYSQNYLSQML